MRKTLLLFALLLGFMANAQDPVLTFDSKTATMPNCNQYYLPMTGITSGGMTWNTYGMSNNSNGWSTSLSPLRFGTKNNASVATITNSEPVTAKISEVEILVYRIKNSANDKLNSIELRVSETSDFQDSTVYTFDISTLPTGTNQPATFKVEIPTPAENMFYRLAFSMPKTTNNGCFGLNTIKFYGEADADALAIPTITLGDNNTVTITADAGLDIYYTLDDTTPTTASTKYTAPFQITGATTVKAIASDGSKTSAVVTKALLPNTVSSLAEFLSLKNSADVKVNVPLTAVYQNGRNLYVTDGTDYVLAYNSANVAAITGQFATNGDRMSFLTGSYKDQYGLPELIPSAVGEKTSGAAVEPEEITVEEIASDNLNHYIVIKNANIVAQSKTNYYDLTDETGTITLYNTFNNASYYNVVNVEEGEGFTVTGFISIYNGTLQVTPVSITGGQVMETVETPVFYPQSGAELSAGDEITITCATEGATIHYTLDGSDPTAASPAYDGSLLFDGTTMEIRAMATKEGYLDSDVAKAVYTLYVEGSTTATFNFSDPTSLNPAAEVPTETNTQIKLNSKNGNNVFTAGPLTLTFSDGTNTSNSPVIIYPTGAATKGNLEGRIYKNNTITLAGNNASITKVTFTQYDNSTTWAGFTTDPDISAATSDKVFAFPSEPTEVVFTSLGTSRYKTIQVEYVNKGTAIDGIDADNSNAPVEYFNLQGVRVNSDNLTGGIYIRRQGSNVSKVYVR